MLKTFSVDFNQFGVDLPIPMHFNVGESLTGFHVILCLVLSRLGYRVELAVPCYNEDPIIAELLEHHLTHALLGVPSNAIVKIKTLNPTTFLIAFTY